MNLKEELLKLYTVEKVEITKDVNVHGVKADEYKIFVRHPVNDRLYYQLTTFNVTLRQSKEEVFNLLKSFLNNWWKKEEYNGKE